MRVDAKPTRARRGPNGGGEDPALCLLPAPISGPGSSCGVDGQGSPGSTGAPLEGLWPPQPGRDLSVVNGPKAFVGVDKRLPPATEGSDRLAPRRTTAITRRSRGRIAAGRCRAFPAAPQIHKTRPLPLKIARRVRMRKDRRIGSAALAGNSGFCASPRIGPFFQEEWGRYG